MSIFKGSVVKKIDKLRARRALPLWGSILTITLVFAFIFSLSEGVVHIRAATAPTIPGNFTITTSTDVSVTLSWSPSTEAGGSVKAYTIHQDGVKIGDSTSTSFTSTGLTPSTTYSFSVGAYDPSGNTSPMSITLSTTTQPQPLNYQLGLSVGGDLINLSTSSLNAALNDIVSLHVGWLRFDMAWAFIQPTQNEPYEWANIDRFVAAANAHHIKLLAVLDYTPAWARPASCTTSDRCAPADPTQFATFAKAAVTRYGPEGLHAWEVWNEPNISPNWLPSANPIAYTVLLKDTYTAIKSIQPAGVVLTGGMAPATSTNGNYSPINFLTQLYANGAEPYFDGVSFHPYSFPVLASNVRVWNAWSQMEDTTPSLRSVMGANGDAGKKIWPTEYGAPTNGPGTVTSDGIIANFVGVPDHVTEALQGVMLADAINSIKTQGWAGPLFIYSYQDAGTSTATNQNFFGLLRYDGSEKPAYTTLKDLGNLP